MRCVLTTVLPAVKRRGGGIGTDAGGSPTTTGGGDAEGGAGDAPLPLGPIPSPVSVEAWPAAAWHTVMPRDVQLDGSRVYGMPYSPGNGEKRARRQATDGLATTSSASTAVHRSSATCKRVSATIPKNGAAKIGTKDKCTAQGARVAVRWTSPTTAGYMIAGISRWSSTWL